MPEPVRTAEDLRELILTEIPSDQDVVVTRDWARKDGTESYRVILKDVPKEAKS